MVESPTATEDDLEKGPKTLKNGNELEKQLSEEIAGEGDRDTDDCGNTDVTRESECLNGMESGRPPLEDEERHIEKDIDSDAKPNNGGAGSGVPESPALHDNLEESHPESLIGTRNSSQKQSSSLEMRKIPVNRLLKPVPDGSVLSSEVTMLMKETPSEKKDLLRMLCLRPGFSLRTQLMLSYGSINAITTIFVIVICVIVAITAGENVKDDYTQSFADQLELGTTARLLAESLDARFMLTNMVDIIHEATLDRFEGYSNESDDEVPFLDMDSQSRKYPFIGEPLPIEWDLKTPVMNAANADELCQSRWDYYKDRPASTVNAGFHMQGVCDPTLTDPNAAAYWPNCTDANNDIATGGVVAPSQTTKQIYRKGSDLMPLLKAIFEAKEEIRDLGLYFANSGAGASMNYPQVAFVANSSYVSIGCDWMKATNPYNKSNTIGTQEMINRCHGEGVVVNSRIYNPLERAWCRDQALHPDRFYADVVADAWSNDDWLLFLGKAVYDRKNREFVACIYIGIPLGSIDEALMDVRITNKTEVSTVAWGEIGTVIVSSVTTDRRSAIYESNLGLTKESYEELYTLVDFDSKWDPEEVRGQYENFRAMDNSYVVSSYPIPAIPDEYDPNYRPVALVIVSFSSEDMFRVVKEVDGVFDEKVKEITLFSIVVGAIGLVAATIIVFTMAHVLTFPLISMDRVASEIVNNFGDPTNESLIDSADRISREVKCAPKTELSQVVKEFNKMVESFSGSYMARSENGKYEEANNLFGLKAVFSKLYKSRDDETFAYKIKEHAESSQDESSEVSDTDRFIHEGSNLLFSTTVTNGEKKSSNRDSTKPKFMSPIFFWTAVLIVTPLLAVNITITAVVMQSVSNEFTDSIATAKDYYLEVQKEALKVKTQLRASYARDFTAKSTSELHILTKYSSWLLFGGLRRADSFTEVTTGIEMCKTRYENFDECEYVQQDSVCDCEWNDGASSFCKTYPDGSRHLQVPFFVYESSATESNGNRDSNAFPNASYSIETTEWWDDPTILPGWETPSSASGLDSTYDRLRSIAALPMLQVLYNADRKKKSLIGAYVAFEADGLFFGYIGCRNSGHVALAAWNSTKENGAAQLRPELCPLGKYGYDPR